MTNLEIIRQMSADELADKLENLICCGYGYQCDNCILRDIETCESACIQKWLESEVKE